MPQKRSAFAGLVAMLLAAAALGAPVIVLDLQDANGPASGSYFLRGLARAEGEGSPLLVLRLDTPGGLDSSMRQMIQGILAARVPVAVYVSPDGARAASAGTYILYAAHVAAMAPATTLGAATPVAIGLGGSERKAAAAGQRAGRQERRSGRPHGGEAGPRRGRLHPRPGPAARAQPRSGPSRPCGRP